MNCNRDCLHCGYKDCINGDYDEDTFLMIVEIEDACGIRSSSDLERFNTEKLEAAFVAQQIQEKREKAAERRRQKRKELKENAC